MDDNKQDHLKNPTQTLPHREGLQENRSHSQSFLKKEGRNDVVIPSHLLYFYTSTPQQWEHLKPLARENRNNQTDGEKIIWSIVRGKRFSTRFRRQHAIGNFIVDFVSLEYQLVIEIDGEIHDQQREYDEWRTSVLNEIGFKVIRFTNEEVLTNIGYVENEIRKHLV